MSTDTSQGELISIQHASDDPLPVDEATILEWIIDLLKIHNTIAEINIRFVSIEEITYLNYTYRHKNSYTNVLAFPVQNLPDSVILEHKILGDVVISPAVVEQESIEQNKPYIEHFAHILAHGILHLLGFDHEYEQDAHIMQEHETFFLKTIGFSNPYKLEGKAIE